MSSVGGRSYKALTAVDDAQVAGGLADVGHEPAADVRVHLLGLRGMTVDAGAQRREFGVSPDTHRVCLTDVTCSGDAVLPVPMAHTGS